MVRFRVTIESRGGTEEERWSSDVEMERRYECGGIIPIQVS